MKFICQNAIHLDVGKFDVIIDKACLDATLCSSDKNPNPTSQKVIHNIYESLEHEGIYICISYAPPDERLSYFKAHKWQILT